MGFMKAMVLLEQHVVQLGESGRHDEQDA